MDPSITIETDTKTIEDMSTYTVSLNGKTIGRLMLWNNNGIVTEAIDIIDPIIYGKTAAFSE